MTTAELLREVLQGVLLIVGDYRGSHAEAAGYVDKKSGEKINYIRAIHLVECCWHGHIGPVLVTQRFPEVVQTVEQAASTFTYTRGRKYAFYIDWFKRDRGQLLASMSAWDPDEIEEPKEAGCAPEGRAPAP
jgi:hypothetical protein